MSKLLSIGDEHYSGKAYRLLQRPVTLLAGSGTVINIKASGTQLQLDFSDVTVDT